MDRPYLCRAWLCDDARDAVLQALDAWAKACGLPLPTGQEGATDADLPELFRGIDAHVDRLIARANFAVPDEPYPEAFVERTRRELAESKARVAKL